MKAKNLKTKTKTASFETKTLKIGSQNLLSLENSKLDHQNRKTVQIRSEHNVQ